MSPTPRPSRPGAKRLLAIGAALAVAAGAALLPTQPFRVVSAWTSGALCYAAFIARQDPDRAYLEEVRPASGMSWVDPLLRYRVDRERREVVTRIAGLFESRAVYRDGLGCLTIHGEPAGGAIADRAIPPAAPGSLGDIAGPAPVTAADAAVRAAIDEAFAENLPQPRRTKAVVVVHRGRVIGERYAEGIGPQTPLWAHSLSKSLTHALIGVLVRQGRIDPARTGLIREWSAPDDPRRQITVEQLLRMTAGLPQDEFGGVMDPAYRMFCLERDGYAFAVGARPVAPPGAQWGYSNLSYMILSRLLRDAVGGGAAGVFDFARSELFAPLGMQSAEMGYDATGTPMGAVFTYASARDWARLGLLYLNGGAADGRQLLPPGWARDAATPTVEPGYGAGFYTNLTDAPKKVGSGRWGMPGAPADAFFARGGLGQYVVVVPGRQLVVVRMGIAHARGYDVEGVGRLVGRVAAALDR